MRILIQVLHWLSFSALIFFLYQSPISFLMLYNQTDQFVSVNLSAAFIFGVFHAHFKDWLTCSGRTDRLSACKYLISKELNQIVNFLTLYPDLDTHKHDHLDLFII